MPAEAAPGEGRHWRGTAEEARRDVPPSKEEEEA